MFLCSQQLFACISIFLSFRCAVSLNLLRRPNHSLAAETQHQASSVSRRQWVKMMASQLLIGGTLLAPSSHAAEFATSAGRQGCTTQSDPSRTVVTCTGDLMGTSGRLKSISSTQNGVSTSAIRNPGAYMAPWSYITETSDATKAWISLTKAVTALPGCQLVTLTDTYMHATVPTIVPLNGGLDDIEFVLRPEDRLVLFRSASQTSVFVYPLTQPLSDRESNRKRMDRLRDTLGWQEFQ